MLGVGDIGLLGLEEPDVEGVILADFGNSTSSGDISAISSCADSEDAASINNGRRLAILP